MSEESSFSISKTCVCDTALVVREERYEGLLAKISEKKLWTEKNIPDPLPNRLSSIVYRSIRMSTRSTRQSLSS